MARRRCRSQQSREGVGRLKNNLLSYHKKEMNVDSDDKVSLGSASGMDIEAIKGTKKFVEVRSGEILYIKESGEILYQRGKGSNLTPISDIKQIMR